MLHTAVMLHTAHAEKQRSALLGDWPILSCTAASLASSDAYQNPGVKTAVWASGLNWYGSGPGPVSSDTSTSSTSGEGGGEKSSTSNERSVAKLLASLESLSILATLTAAVN